MHICMHECCNLLCCTCRQQFKALPLNSKILDPFYHGMCGVVKEASRPATKPITPKLATAKREALRKRSDKPHPSTTAFRAQEIPKDMFSSVKVSMTCV